MIAAPMCRVAVLIVLAALAGVAAVPAAAKPLARDLAIADARIGWTNLTGSEHERVLRRWKAAPDPLPALLRRLAGRLSVHRSDSDAAANGNSTDTTYDGRTITWQVNRSWNVLGYPSRLGAHLTLHELGHVIDGALIDADLRNEFLALFRLSPYWSNCHPMPQGSSSRCVTAPEIFADQFAFWATGYGLARTFYNLPPFTSRAAFGALLSGLAPTPKSAPSRAVRVRRGSAP